MTDPLETIARALDRARRERDAIQNQAEQSRLEIHQLRRRLEVAQDQNRVLQDRVVEMQTQLEAANERADASKRAMLEHAGRV